MLHWLVLQQFPPTETEIAAFQKGEDVISLERAAHAPKGPGKGRRKGPPGAAHFTAAQIKVLAKVFTSDTFKLHLYPLPGHMQPLMLISPLAMQARGKMVPYRRRKQPPGRRICTMKQRRGCLSHAGILMTSVVTSLMSCAQERLASHSQAQSRPEVQAIAAARAALPIAPYRCVQACGD